jgi:membrane protein YdbS with pleckstrin-like domain
MYTSPEPKLVYHHITVYIWFSWFLVLLSLGLMSTWFLGFQIGLYLGLCALLFSLIYVFKNYLEHWSEYIILEDSCITLVKGIFFKSRSQIPYYKINNIFITDFLWIHNLTLDTGNDTTNIHFHAIERASELREELYERIEQERHYTGLKNKNTTSVENIQPNLIQSQYDNLEKQSMARFQSPEPQQAKSQNNFLPQQSTQPQNQPNHVIDELERLNRLKIQGVLSPVEFEFAKKRVLMGK